MKIVLLILGIALLGVFGIALANAGSLFGSLMFWVYLIETATQWDFISFGEVFSAVGWITAALVACAVLGFMTVIEGKIKQETYVDGWKKFATGIYVNCVVVALVIGMLGSMANQLIPDKQTAYIMAGAYVTQASFENCSEEGTACNEIVKKMNDKALGFLDGGIEKAVEQAEQKLENAVEDAGEALNEKTKGVQDAAESVSKTTTDVANVVKDAAQTVEKTAQGINDSETVQTVADAAQAVKDVSAK